MISNDASKPSRKILKRLKLLYQTQIPKMPNDILTHLTYNPSHKSLVIIQRPFNIIAGITFETHEDHGFADILLCAVLSDEQVKGYGTLLMAQLRRYLKATSLVTQLLTYADNFAMGYFEKQCFTTEITLPKAAWLKYVEDYEGGILMQCSVDAQRHTVALDNEENIQDGFAMVHEQPQQSSTDDTTPIDAQQPHDASHPNLLQHFLYQIQSHPQAWPFLKPVDRIQVPTYYTIITSPIDLSTMNAKLETGAYTSLKHLVADLSLMFRNCRQYYDAGSLYVKCADRLEAYMEDQLKILGYDE